MAGRATLEEADRSSPCPSSPCPYLFLSREDVRDTETHNFRSVLFHPMLSNANLLRAMLNRIILDFRSIVSNPYYKGAVNSYLHLLGFPSDKNIPLS